MRFSQAEPEASKKFCYAILEAERPGLGAQAAACHAQEAAAAYEAQRQVLEDERQGLDEEAAAYDAQRQILEDEKQALEDEAAACNASRKVLRTTEDLGDSDSQEALSDDEQGQVLKCVRELSCIQW